MNSGASAFNTQAAVAGGDEFTNDGFTHFFVQNNSADQRIVTFVAQTPVKHPDRSWEGQSAEFLASRFLLNRVATIPGGTQYISESFSREFYNKSNGKVAVTYDGVVDVVVGAFRLRPSA